MIAASATIKKITRLPNHVAIIMDGNGRWAKQRGLLRLEGHRAGAENMRSVIEYFIKLKLKHLALYSFSTENWKRPEEKLVTQERRSLSWLSLLWSDNQGSFRGAMPL